MPEARATDLRAISALPSIIGRQQPQTLPSSAGCRFWYLAGLLSLPGFAD
jgi:hypothetical protein